jgi:hypothetical protein
MMLQRPELRQRPAAYPGVVLLMIAVGPLMTVGPGTYEVGTGNGQIAPRNYFSPTPSSGSTCYYAHLRGNDGEAGDIIADGLSPGAAHHDCASLRRVCDGLRCTFIAAS